MSQTLDSYFQVKSSSSLIRAIDQAADRELSNRSEYVRRAVMDRLRADGVEIAPREVA